MPVSCVAQVLSQLGIVHASRGDHATNAHGDESKGTLTSLRAVQIGLEYLQQLLQHVTVGALHDIAAPHDVGGERDQGTARLAVIEMVVREV